MVTRMKGHAPVPDKTVHHTITYWSCSCGNKFLGYTKRHAGVQMKNHVAEMQTEIARLESEIENVRRGVIDRAKGAV